MWLEDLAVVTELVGALSLVEARALQGPSRFDGILVMGTGSLAGQQRERPFCHGLDVQTNPGPAHEDRLAVLGPDSGAWKMREEEAADRGAARGNSATWPRRKKRRKDREGEEEKGVVESEV